MTSDRVDAVHFYLQITHILTYGVLFIHPNKNISLYVWISKIIYIHIFRFWKERHNNLQCRTKYIFLSCVVVFKCFVCVFWFLFADKGFLSQCPFHHLSYTFVKLTVSTFYFCRFNNCIFAALRKFNPLNFFFYESINEIQKRPVIPWVKKNCCLKRLCPHLHTIAHHIYRNICT